MTEQTADQGARAEALLRDEVLLQAMDDLKQSAIDRLLGADVNDGKTLCTLVMSLQSVSALRRRLEIVAVYGREALEKQEQQRKETLMQRVRGRFTGVS